MRAGHPGIDEAVLEAAASLADQGDLATAEETLMQGLDGAELVTEHHSDIDFAELFPAVVADLAGGIDAEVVNAAAGRARYGASFAFSGLSADAATSSGQALSRWQGLATSTKRTDLRAGLAPALRLLGVGAGGDRAAPNLPRSAERAWVDLTGGWSVRLDRLAVDGRAKGATAAMAALHSELERSPQVLLEAAGLAEPGLLSATCAQLVELLGDGAEGSEAIIDLLDLDGGVPAEVALRTAVAAGVVAASDNGKLATERVVTAAWSAAEAARPKPSEGPLGERPGLCKKPAVPGVLR